MLVVPIFSTGYARFLCCCWSVLFYPFIIVCFMCANCFIKLAFHDSDTDTDTDSPSTATILRPTHAISSRESSRGCPCRCRCWRRGMPALGFVMLARFWPCSCVCLSVHYNRYRNGWTYHHAANAVFQYHILMTILMVTPKCSVRGRHNAMLWCLSVCPF